MAAEDFAAQRNAHIVVSLPGVVRGNHFHTQERETITVLGPSLVRFREEGNIEEILVPDKEARLLGIQRAFAFITIHQAHFLASSRSPSSGFTEALCASRAQNLS